MTRPLWIITFFLAVQCFDFPVQSLTLGQSPSLLARDATIQRAMPGQHTAAGLRNVDPAAEGWDTEQFSERAQSQLRRLGGLLEDPSIIDTVHVQPMVAAGFTCGPLRALAMERIFEDQGILVHRADEWSRRTDRRGDPVHRDAGGFVKALQDLIHPLANATQRRVQFHMFRVNAHETHTTTTQYVSLSGHLENGSIEQHATWDCRWTDGATPKLLGITVSDYEQTEVFSETGPTLFVDCTVAALAHNPSFKHQLMPGIPYWMSQVEWSSGIGVSGHFGLAVGDVNGDELEDIYLCQTGGLPNRLFVQNSDGTATDRSAWAGVDWYDRTTSALLVDLDNDGDQDLVLGTNPGVLIMSNDGTGRFKLRRTVRTILFASGLAAADYDLDGDVDIYVSRYNPLWFETKDVPSPIPYYDANNGGANFLLRNDGDWEFRDATPTSGLDTNNSRWTYAAAWEDYDNDGDIDLYVANDYGRNCLYRNDVGHFVDVAKEAGVEDIGAGMSASWGDYNGDGLMDLYVGNMYSTAGQRIASQPTFLPGSSPAARSLLQRMAQGNRLFSNSGDGTFADVSVDAGVAMGRWSWGSIFVDLNNDGWQDLVVANGFLSDEDTDDL